MGEGRGVQASDSARVCAATVSMRFRSVLSSSPLLPSPIPSLPLSVSDSATRRRSVSVCSAHSNADTARTHPLRTRSTQREGSEGQTDRQSLRAVAVGLSRSTELRLPPPRRMPLLLLIALRKDGAPTSVPPPPPNHVAPSADRPIGPSAGADLTSVRPSVHIGAAEAPAAFAPRTTLHYSLTHSHSV